MIARLERVPLREVWRHEAYDFTRWLEENIEVLNEVIDLTLDNLERERKTESTFSVDLVAEDQNGSTVIIENQLGKSDHDHLGKVITYLTAMEAKSAIWIVADPRPEHIRAITWLNETSAAAFYLLKVEAIRIGDSPPAPLLTLIVQLSEEGREVGQTKQEFSERYHERELFWSKLLEHPDAHLHKHITPRKYSWLGLSAGVAGMGFNYATTKYRSSAELYIDRGKDRSQENDEIFEQLWERKEEIESAFGGPLSWEHLEGKRACRVRAPVEGGYRSTEDQNPRIYDNLTDAMNRLVSALKPVLEEIQFG